jgi:hypothetical protein
MTKIIIDDDGRAKLSDVNERVELCDKSGKVVGYFYPVEDPEDAIYANLKVPFTEEELQRRENETGGSSLAEFWQRMDPK